MLPGSVIALLPKLRIVEYEVGELLHEPHCHSLGRYLRHISRLVVSHHVVGFRYGTEDLVNYA
jgi:hypothetical protein